MLICCVMEDGSGMVVDTVGHNVIEVDGHFFLGVIRSDERFPLNSRPVIVDSAFEANKFLKG